MTIFFDFFLLDFAKGWTAPTRQLRVTRKTRRERLKSWNKVEYKEHDNKGAK